MDHSIFWETSDFQFEGCTLCFRPIIFLQNSKTREIQIQPIRRQDLLRVFQYQVFLNTFMKIKFFQDFI